MLEKEVSNFEMKPDGKNIFQKKCETYQEVSDWISSFGKSFASGYKEVGNLSDFEKKQISERIKEFPELLDILENQREMSEEETGSQEEKNFIAYVIKRQPRDR